MGFQYSFRLAMAVTLSVSALSANAQSSRATGLDTGIGITSITDLKPARHSSPPFGTIDASYGNGVSLEVWAIPDSSDQVPEQLQGSRKSELQGTASGNPGTKIPNAAQAALLNSGRLDNFSGSTATANSSLIQKGGGATPEGSELPSSRGASSPFPSGASSGSTGGVSSGSMGGASAGSLAGSSRGSMEGVSFPKRQGEMRAMSQSGSNSDVSKASSPTNIHSLKHAHFGPDAAGSFRSSRDLLSSRVRVIPGDSSADPLFADQSTDSSSSDDERDGADTADKAPVDSASSQTEGSTEASQQGKAAGQQGKAGFFEAVRDPFLTLIPDREELEHEFRKAERACGDSCFLEGLSGGTHDSTFGSSQSVRSPEETSDTSGSTQESKPGTLVDGELPHSRLEGVLGRLSDSTSVSTSRSGTSLKDMKKVESGLSGQTDRRRPSK